MRRKTIYEHLSGLRRARVVWGTRVFGGKKKKNLRGREGAIEANPFINGQAHNVTISTIHT